MTDAIYTDGLRKRFAETLALQDLDLRVRTGEVFGYVGPNGAGKSTTIALVLGLQSPTAGDVRVLDRPPSDAAALRRRVGVLPENAGLFPRLTGAEHLEFLIGVHESDDTASGLLRRVGLDNDGHRRVDGYSTGMAQRLRLALALVGKPDLLVLDEPAAGLDPEGITRLREIIDTERERGAAVFFSSHHLDDVAAVSDRVGFLVEGQLLDVVATDTTAEALSTRFTELVREGA